jgi:Fic family protein
MAQPTGYSLEGATPYHYGQFPPQQLDYEQIIRPLGAATEALARYDALLSNLHNKELFLAPLRSKEAVISSRIEGTIATLEEVLRIQADAEDEGDPDRPIDAGRPDALEVFAYVRAMRHAQKAMEEGLPICARLIRETHSRLLFLGRGQDKTPGEFKTDQNYVVDKRQKRVLFVPIEAGDALNKGISALEKFINEQNVDYLIQTALAHLEFEALHPFKDGNGRVGRMIITLNLWDKKKISGPYFYISDYLESNREEYIDRLRRVSADGEWTEWVIFFLSAIASQAAHNIEMSAKVIKLYEEMKDVFRQTLSSQWCTVALDYVFEKAVFRNSAFTSHSGIPPQTAHRITRALAEKGLLLTVEPASGRRAALYAFTPLLNIVRE